MIRSARIYIETSEVIKSGEVSIESLTHLQVTLAAIQWVLLRGFVCLFDFFVWTVDQITSNSSFIILPTTAGKSESILWYFYNIHLASITLITGTELHPCSLLLKLHSRQNWGKNQLTAIHDSYCNTICIGYSCVIATEGTAALFDLPISSQKLLICY